MENVFLVSLYGTITRKKLIVGFFSYNNKDIIADYIKHKYGFTLQDLVQNEFKFQNDCHWQYTTNASNVNICIDLCHNLDNYEDEQDY